MAMAHKIIGKINENFRYTFNEEIQIIKNGIVKNISECNAKKEKDIIIIVDFNIYKKRDNNEINIHIIDAFLTETKIILKYYLRYAVFIYETGYKIICPLLYKYQIDIKSFSKDLINYKNIILKDYINKNELMEDINSKDFEYELNDKIFSDSSQE